MVYAISPSSRKQEDKAKRAALLEKQRKAEEQRREAEFDISKFSFFSPIFSVKPSIFKSESFQVVPKVNQDTTVKPEKTVQSDRFSDKSTVVIEDMAKRLNFNPEDLKAVIMHESGAKPSAVNKKSGATGVIQFMPSTAKELGTSTKDLKQMSMEEQLPYVEKYLVNAKKIAKLDSDTKIDRETLYCLVFSPAYAKKNKQDVLYKEGSKAYSWNKGLDVNKDGQIAKAELGGKLEQYYA